MTEAKNSGSPTEAPSQANHVTTYQTVGPYFKIGLEALYQTDLTNPNTPGRVIEVADGTDFLDSSNVERASDADRRTCSVSDFERSESGSEPHRPFSAHR